MVPRPTLRALASDLPDFRIYSGGGYLGEDTPRFAPEDVDAEDAPLVEGETLVGTTVAPALQSGFTHFMDGAQKSQAIGDHLGYPVYLAHTSAAIVERQDRSMVSPSETWYRERLAFYMPGFLECRTKMKEFVEVVEVQGTEGDPIERLRNETIKRISNERDAQERLLLQQFGEGRLVTDGNLTNAKRSDGSYKFVIGVVKSHACQYFKSRERAQAVLGLLPGQRSSVFAPKTSKNQESVYSFYLRMQGRPDRPSLYGLIRVETPPQKEYLDMADEIASWLLAERAPTSLPDPRHDKLIYPIHWIEQYLRSRQPSDAAIASILG